MKNCNRARSARLSVAGSQSGAAAVEMALLLPLLIVTVFGIIEFGAFLYNQQVLTNASREGARAGIIQRGGAMVSDSEIRTVVNTYASGRLVTFGGGDPLPGTDIEAPNGTTVGSPLIVTSTYDFSFLVIGNFFGFDDPYEMSAQTTMLYE